MPSISLSLDEKTYQRLLGRKRPYESMAAVIRKILQEKLEEEDEE